MNTQEKIQAASDMIKEHVLKGGVLVGGEANTLYKLAQQYVKYCK